MFLDPEPKRGKQSMSGSSGFFSSQRPIESPRDHRTTTRRKLHPLAERSQSQINQQTPWRDADNSTTVRLVKPSPPRPVESGSDTEEDEIAAIKGNTQGQPVLPASAVVKPASASNAGLPGFAAAHLAKSVSDSDTTTNGAQTLGQSDTASLLHTTPTHAPPATTHAAPGPEWHRRSGSTGNQSTSSTLKGGDENISYPRIERSSIRLSQGTTLRGTPTPTEQELRQRFDPEESLASVHTLQTLQEASPERSTLRAVSVSDGSGSVDELSHSESSSSPVIEVFPSPSSGTEGRLRIPERRSSWQALSASSPQTVRHYSDSSGTHTPRGEQTPESVVRTESAFPSSSSPNYVAYSPDSSRPRSGTYPIHHQYSIESIQSRLQYPTAVRPETGFSITPTSSWASLRPSSSHDTLPPLQVPKKRLRHKAGIASLNAAASASYTSGRSMAEEDYDTLPYPREPFSSHLSTIASESDRTTSQQLSHFSLGSGVLTGDDSSSIPLSGTWPRRRRESAPISSIASDAPASTSEEEAGDMTLGVFREESAKPQPLFLPRAGAVPGESKYDGPLPPLPPVPPSRDSEENTDRVSELQPPVLREKRSGYSLRRRSNSTPSRSHSRHLSQLSRSETDRWSQASSLFPTWAKNFYVHGATLMSASKVSLTAPSTPQRRENIRAQHARDDSQWTDCSITSRLGTGYSEISNPVSPASSHFLPAIFRPRTRKNNETSRSRKSKRSRRSGDSRPDSLQIFSDPLRPPTRDADILPSGHPKYGSLKDDPTAQQQQQGHRPLPRKYSKQRHWDGMQFPRPMTKDRLSDFNMNAPHLAPNTKRSSYRLSAWRAPSFVESLDTLVRARGNRQILLFACGFVCPLLWMLGAVLPLPARPADSVQLREGSSGGLEGSEDDIQAAMMKHEAGDAEQRWREEKAWAKARWWRRVNRVMSAVGLLVIGAVIALAVIATR